MTYEEFERHVIVEPTYGFMSDELASVELRFQIRCRADLKGPKAMDSQELQQRFIEHLKRELYDDLFVQGVPYPLVEESGMTEEQFASWCRQKMYEDAVITV